MPRRDLGIALLALSALPAQSPAPRPQFDVASIKRDTNCSGRRSGGHPGSPGRLNLECATLQSLIQLAYGMMANGISINYRLPEINGGPTWMKSDTYDVAARAENASYGQMGGPMLRALLEDRFNLRIHRETKEVPVYFLIVAKGGIQLEATREGSCTNLDLSRAPQPATGPPVGPPLPSCGNQSMRNTRETVRMTSIGTTMEHLVSGILSVLIGRTILDRTGLTGQYDIQLEFARETSGASASAEPGAGPPPTDLAGPSVFEAFRRLGLKLEPGKGPIEILVVDRVERPTEN